MSGVGDEQQTAKDTTYSPASETEVQQAQEDDGAGILPGGGGPDDSGQVDAAEAVGGEIRIPRDSGAH